MRTPKLFLNQSQGGNLHLVVMHQWGHRSRRLALCPPLKLFHLYLPLDFFHRISQLLSEILALCSISPWYQFRNLCPCTDSAVDAAGLRRP